MVRNVSAGHSHTACLTEDGRAFTWGMASNGKLGIGATERIGEVYVKEERGREERRRGVEKRDKRTTL